MPSIFLQPQLLAGRRPGEGESSVPETRRNAKNGIRELRYPQATSGAERPPFPKTRAAGQGSDVPDRSQEAKASQAGERGTPARSPFEPARQRLKPRVAGGTGGAAEKIKKKPRRWGRGRPRRACSDPHKRDCVPPVPVPREPHRRRPADAVLPKRPLPALRRIR